jgi:hypothetical protein
VRDAAEGRLRVPAEDPAAVRLRDEIRRGNFRRDAATAAAVLWLSGLIWLALSTRIAWLGWLQMSAAIVVFLWSRYSRLGS